MKAQFIVGLVLSLCSLPLQAQETATQPLVQNPALQTLVMDRNLKLTISQIPDSCAALRVSILRKDPLKPSFGAFTRPVRRVQSDAAQPATLHQLSLELGAEFWPHVYQAGDLRLSCFDAAGQPGLSWSSAQAIAFDKAEVLLDVPALFKVSDEKAE